MGLMMVISYILTYFVDNKQQIMAPKEKAIIKFNGGNLALLCSGCSVIVKTGKEFTSEEMEFALTKGKHLEPQYCESCKNKKDDK